MLPPLPRWFSFRVMCGRYTLAPGQGNWEFADIRIQWDGKPRYNIAPSQRAPVIITERGIPVLREMRWGLVPSWATDPKIGFSLVNARSESVATKPAFRGAFRHRRCLVPADGFYEWQTVGKSKQPWRFVRPDRQLFAFAGLWECWTDPLRSGEILETFSLLTTVPNETVLPVHDRMPVILENDGIGPWLEPSTSIQVLEGLLRSYPTAHLIRYPVSDRVGNPRNDGPDCIDPVVPSNPAPAPLQGELL